MGADTIFDNFYGEKEKDLPLKRIKETEIYFDKIRGSMIGGAAGDALGYKLEFLSEKSIFLRYGERGYRNMRLTR